METDHHFGSRFGLHFALLRSYLVYHLEFLMFAGQDKDENGNQNYSSYVELNFPFTVKGVDLNATCGVLPYDAGITTYGGDVNSGFAVTNVALKATKDIKITDSFLITYFTQAIWNPRMEDAHLVLGISLRP